MSLLTALWDIFKAVLPAQFSFNSQQSHLITTVTYEMASSTKDDWLPFMYQNINLRVLDKYGAKAVIDRAEQRNDLHAFLLKWDEAEERRLEDAFDAMDIHSDEDTRSSEEHIEERRQRRKDLDRLVRKWEKTDALRLQHMFKSLRYNNPGSLDKYGRNPETGLYEAAWYSDHDDDSSEEEDPELTWPVIVPRERLATAPKRLSSPVGQVKDADLESESDYGGNMVVDMIRGDAEPQTPLPQHGRTLSVKKAPPRRQLAIHPRKPISTKTDDDSLEELQGQEAAPGALATDDHRKRKSVSTGWIRPIGNCHSTV